MKVRFEDFIMIMDHAITAEYADRLVEHIDYCEKLGLGKTRQETESWSQHEKEDYTIFNTETIYEFPPETSMSICGDFLKGLYESFKIYEEQFSILKNCDPIMSYYSRLQKTRVGQGYHLWHCEDNARSMSNRIAAWMLYLNDVQEGGETEFLYYHKRIKPTKGTLLIWPAGFTHTHRGNPPLSNDKYVITGWFEM